MDFPRNSCLYNLGKTNTFRSSSSAILDTWGTNLQNIEGSLRSIYIPDKGKILIQRDQRGAEALIVAYLSRAGKYRDLFIFDISPHVYLCSQMFNDRLEKENPKLPWNEIKGLEPKIIGQHPQWKEISSFIKETDNWPSQKRYYYFGKQTGHSASYGIRAPKFRMNILEKSEGEVYISKYDSEYFLAFFRDLYNEIPNWNVETINTIKRTRTLYNLFGHPRYFGGNLDKDETYREAHAFVPQSTVGEITHVTFRNMQEFIERENLKDWDLLTNTHDSILMQVIDDAENIRFASETLERFINQWFKSPKDGTPFQMKSDCAVGYNWSKYHKENNSKGLKEYGK